MAISKAIAQPIRRKNLSKSSISGVAAAKR
jgi:hypothetical protein